MLLPQSSAFAALKNRLNSVSAIGYLHIAPRAYVPSPNVSFPQPRNNSVVEAVSNFTIHQRQKSITETHASIHSAPASAGPSNYDRPNRLKGRDEGIKWTELLDKFKAVQERARRAQRPGEEHEDGMGLAGPKTAELDAKALKDLSRMQGPPAAVKEPGPSGPAQAHKSRSSLGKFGRLGGGMSGSRPKR
jgi:vacuole morphology and inheritance protein 14